jgi:hypothetical protein
VCLVLTALRLFGDEPDDVEVADEDYKPYGHDEANKVDSLSYVRDVA